MSEDIKEINGKSANTKYWLEKYPRATEDIDDDILELWGQTLSTTVYFDSDHAHDQLTRPLVSGVLSFVGSTPFSWNINRQGTIVRSSYSAELCAGRVASEEAIALRYMLRYLGVPV